MPTKKAVPAEITPKIRAAMAELRDLLEIALAKIPAKPEKAAKGRKAAK